LRPLRPVCSIDIQFETNLINLDDNGVTQIHQGALPIAQAETTDPNGDHCQRGNGRNAPLVRPVQHAPRRLGLHLGSSGNGTVGVVGGVRIHWFIRKK
jgi:hypothetical protein